MNFAHGGIQRITADRPVDESALGPYAFPLKPKITRSFLSRRDLEISMSLDQTI